MSQKIFNAADSLISTISAILLIAGAFLLFTAAESSAESDGELQTLEVPAEETSGGLSRFEYKAEKMAVPVRLIFYAESKEKAEEAAAAVYSRFDELNEMMSDYNPESEIVRACRESGETGKPVEISQSLYAVLKRAREINQLSEGAFDISVSPIVKLWRRTRIYGKLPPADYLEKAKELVGNENWNLTETTVNGESRFALQVLKKDVRLDLGGIAKGYAIDEGIRVLESLGITSALIDAGGDIRVSAAPPGKEGWMVSGLSLSGESGTAYYLTVENLAIAASGDTFQYFEIGGVRYSHIIDPRSGEPLTRHSVVSVSASDATTADALASALTVLGPDEGIRILETSLSGIETMMLFDIGTGKPEIRATGRFCSFVEDRK